MQRSRNAASARHANAEKGPKKRVDKTNGAPAAPRGTSVSAAKKPAARTKATSAAKPRAARAEPAPVVVAVAPPEPMTEPTKPALHVRAPMQGSRPGAPFGRSHNGGPPFMTYVAQMPPSKPVNFKVGDKAVHPAHGVGEITAISQRDIGGSKQMFYDIRILDNGMKVMVPTAAAMQVGLREIMSEKDANDILTTMRAREVAVDVQPWSRRFRVYTEMIKSGSPIEVAKVLRDMNRLKFDKDLSFGERRLLDQAKSLLMKELAFAKKLTEEKMAEEVGRIFTA